MRMGFGHVLEAWKGWQTKRYLPVTGKAKSQNTLCWIQREYISSVSCSVGVAWTEFQRVWHGWSSISCSYHGCGMGGALPALSPTTPAILFDYLQELTSRQRRWMLGRRGSSFRSGIQLAKRDITPFGRGSTEEPRCVHVCACLCERVWAGVLDSS